MARSAYFLLAGLALAGCREEGAPGGNAAGATKVVEQAASSCTPPELALANDAQLESEPMEETKANFAKAYKGACDKGVLKQKALIDPKATDQHKLFLINAPEANVASIYLSDVDDKRMVLEYSFLTTGGKTQVPSADELAEAIYCEVVGAPPEEQASSGRCLVD